MRFTRLIPALAVPMLVVACAQDDPTAPDPPQLQAASIPKLEFPIDVMFDAFNPCTGLDHIVTLKGTFWNQTHPNNRTLRWRATLTTSDGYAGHYIETWTGSNIFGPGDVSNHTFNITAKHPSGSRFKVHLVWIMDEKTSPPTVRVDKFALTCIRP
jgi:hypothetical protein